MHGSQGFKKIVCYLQYQRFHWAQKNATCDMFLFIQKLKKLDKENEPLDVRNVKCCAYR
jgi:pantothenate kinase